MSRKVPLPGESEARAQPFREDQVVLAEGVSKSYGARKAVDGVSFRVRRGETFGLLGPNGAGKSTTMRMIACRTPLTGGELSVEGLDVRAEARRIRSLIGVVPQENNLDPDISVRQNLLVYARYFRLPRAEAEERTDELLRFVGLQERPTACVFELSGGMKRRLMIARALLHNPRLLVLDEPTTGLDPHVRQEIWQRLEELRRRKGLTVILSTHYMDEAERLCDRLLIILRGQIILEGRPAELVARHTALYALEIRDAEGLGLQTVSDERVRAVERSGAHLYFGDSPEQLAPYMKFYEGRRMLLRPSNLEDVFLEVIGEEGLEEELRREDI
ncbi:MAG TPA: ABC transporter ATP-binding protein [Pyrinomonadaceae bacterium]|nr:ABC transporter ATP-binding protein [Pyrinomonadaceae bacterium]